MAFYAWFHYIIKKCKQYAHTKSITYSVSLQLRYLLWLSISKVINPNDVISAACREEHPTWNIIKYHLFKMKIMIYIIINKTALMNRKKQEKNTSTNNILSMLMQAQSRKYQQ